MTHAPSRRRGLKILVLSTVVVVLLAVAGIVAFFHFQSADVASTQAELDPFYEVGADQIPGEPGSIIRYAPMTVNVSNATVYRVLYRTRSSDGVPRVSSGMIFIPTAKAPAAGRDVVAWAHPTLGMGDACAPSRAKDTLLDMGFVQGMINNNWVITATDYAGVGTEGVGRYLVGQDEANDVSYSVAMASAFPNADTSKNWAVYGHSQGGHSSLWTGELGAKILPAYKLMGTVAVAPAAELVPLIAQQWNKAPQWAIGPNFIVGWKDKYPQLPLDGVLTPEGEKAYPQLANDCVVEAALDGHLKFELGQNLFAVNPLTIAPWLQIAEEQTPPPLPASMPTLIVQGTDDNLVLPNTQALLNEKWCAAGSDLSMLWLDGASHLSAASLSGTAVTQWIQARFEGRKPSNTCGLSMPVQPYQS